MARKKTTQKQKQKQSQKVIVNVGGRGSGKGGGKKVIHHHHSINQVLTDASSTHAINNASNAFLSNVANATRAFETREAEKEANAVRLSYGVNPMPAFIRGFNKPAQPPAGSGAERDAIARADAPNDNLIDARMPVARGYRRIITTEPFETSSAENNPIRVAVAKRLIEDENDLALNKLSLRNPSDMVSTQPFINTLSNTEEFTQNNPMMANTALRPNTGDGALSITQLPKRLQQQEQRVKHNEEMMNRMETLVTKAQSGRAVLDTLQKEIDIKKAETRRTMAKSREEKALEAHNERMRERKAGGGGGGPTSSSLRASIDRSDMPTANLKEGGGLQQNKQRSMEEFVTKK